MNPIKNKIILCFSMIYFMACTTQSRLETVPEFQKFDATFSTLQWQDTLDSQNESWSLGHLHEVDVPIISNELFYTNFDTSKMEYRNWTDKIYAEGKIKLPNQHTGYFVSRQYEDITYDRTTVLIVLDKNYNYVQDFVFSEFIGYEGYITETQTQLIQHNWIINSKKKESYFDYKKEEHIEKIITFGWKWKNNRYVKFEK